MKFGLLAFAVLCAVSLVACKEDASRFEKLTRQAAKTPVIEMDSAKYRQYIDVTARNYSAVVMFTATSPKYGCTICQEFANAFVKFGESYSMHFISHPADFASKPVFLVKIDADKGMDVFQSLKFTTVPHVIFFPAGQAKPSISQDWYMPARSFDEEAFQSFVASKTGHKILPYVSPMVLYTKIASYVAGAIFALFVLRSIYRSRHNPMLWFSFSMIVYLIVMMGVVYNFIHNPPLYDVDRKTRQPIYIMNQARSQYVAEGIIVAILLFVIGMIFTSLTTAVQAASTPSRQRAIFFVVSSLFLMALMFLDKIYRIKYYRSAWEVPPDVIDFFRIRK
eukprot:TRINITY_DN5611_c0_g1_i2.p1 TRINITY_DN5611_c0_g1~~TRINITY_DN5611_c0_g1_i2.p1  ORF type:complete len:336 (-),score=90.93 TRINITY_DN5611_c0_g1_i2:34-1041(-)